MTKQEKVAKLTESYNQSNLLPVPTKEWTTEDEGKLQQLKRSEVELADTALGRKKALMQLKFQAAGVDMPQDKFNRIVSLGRENMRRMMQNNRGK
jgi:hypothetical protein